MRPEILLLYISTLLLIFQTCISDVQDGLLSNQTVPVVVSTTTDSYNSTSSSTTASSTTAKKNDSLVKELSTTQSTSSDIVTVTNRPRRSLMELPVTQDPRKSYSTGAKKTTRKEKKRASKKVAIRTTGESRRHNVHRSHKTRINHKPRASLRETDLTYHQKSDFYDEYKSYKYEPDDSNHSFQDLESPPTKKAPLTYREDFDYNSEMEKPLTDDDEFSEGSPGDDDQPPSERLYRTIKHQPSNGKNHHLPHHSHRHFHHAPNPDSTWTAYRTFSHMPLTSFRCDQVQYPGYYADVEANCQVWHICEPDGRHHRFMCPNGTLFDQRTLVCNWWYNVDCGKSSSKFYYNRDIYGGQPFIRNTIVQNPQEEIIQEHGEENSDDGPSYRSVLSLDRNGMSTYQFPLNMEYSSSEYAASPSINSRKVHRKRTRSAKLLKNSDHLSDSSRRPPPNRRSTRIKSIRKNYSRKLKVSKF